MLRYVYVFLCDWCWIPVLPRYTNLKMAIADGHKAAWMRVSVSVFCAKGDYLNEGKLYCMFFTSANKKRWKAWAFLGCNKYVCMIQRNSVMVGMVGYHWQEW